METTLAMAVPSAYETFYTELKTTPFYKTEDGYRFASYLLSETDTETKVHAFLSGDPSSEWSMPSWVADQVRELLGQTVKDLEDLLVSDQDLTVWMTSKKSVGSVAAYRKILETFLEQLLAIQMTQSRFPNGHSIRAMEEDDEENRDTYGAPCIRTKHGMIGNFGGMVLGFLDMDEDYEDEQERIRQSCQDQDTNVVLNHRNPFADISIKEQQFLYGSDYGQFEVLGLSTNHTLTMVPKTTEQSCMVLQPGFKIRKMRDLEESGQNTVLFDDTLSTEVTQSDNNVYVYID